MNFRTLGIAVLLSLLTSALFANGRSPAVEDFVGIEIEEPEATPQGTEALFNFEKDIKDFHTDTKDVSKSINRVNHPEAEAPFNALGILSIFALIGLPLSSWMVFLGHLKRKASSENASNIEVLENYRKEREKKRSRDSDIRKAS